MHEGPEQELGWWDDPTHLSVTGTLISPERASIASASPSWTRTHSAPLALKSSIASATMPQSAHARVTVTADTMRWLTSSTKPQMPQSAFRRRRPVCSNSAQTLTASHRGPTSADLLTLTDVPWYKQPLSPQRPPLHASDL